MRLDDLPSELLIEVLSFLDYQSISAVTQVSSLFHRVSMDSLVWRSLHQSSFSPGRHALCNTDWFPDYARRVATMRAFLIQGSNEYDTDIARRMFSEMSVENVQFLARMVESSSLSVSTILVECHGFLAAQAFRLLRLKPFEDGTRRTDQYRDRLPSDPRSEVFLVRMLLARHLGYERIVPTVDRYLTCAHLITYNSTDYPLFFFPPTAAVQQSRYELRSRSLPSEITGPVINWGVIETIYSLIKLYLDKMGEAIPHFVKSDDDYESEIPMCKAMFDADLFGNWKGLYGYLDFRELEVLHFTRDFSPDFFDGLQKLKIGPEEEFEEVLDESSRHGGAVEHSELDDNVTTWPSTTEHDLGSDASSAHPSSFRRSSQPRFVADGHSAHGHFHIHGSTQHIPGKEPGFKIVRFDAMYNSDGMMPWVMDGVNIPSIGIVGRWRDRSDPPGHGVEGPYVLWRDRQQDSVDQEELMQQYRTSISNGIELAQPNTCKTGYLKRPESDLAYIIVEELQKVLR